MYRVLLVEDEEIIRKGIRYSVLSMVSPLSPP